MDCQKNNFRGYCEQCLDKPSPCFDPEIYCKFRSQCIIWNLAKEAGLHKKKDPDAAQAAT